MKTLPPQTPHKEKQFSPAGIAILAVSSVCIIVLCALIYLYGVNSSFANALNNYFIKITSWQ